MGARDVHPGTQNGKQKQGAMVRRFDGDGLDWNKPCRPLAAKLRTAKAPAAIRSLTTLLGPKKQKTP